MNEPLWKLWRNPIIGRFATARLRWLSLLAWALPLQALAAFLWLTVYLVFHRRQGFSPADSALFAWLIILFLQGVIWLMKGTFSVATGIAREGVEGLTEAQILTPLSSWHKTIGYLIGLPIRETVLAFSILPWSLVSIYLAKVPIACVVRIHLLLFTAALLHHALGLVAGTVIRQKIIAGTFSQVIVVLLHVIIPLVSSLGLAPLGQLSVGDSIASEIAPLSKNGLTIGGEPLVSMSHLRFFRWELTLTGYQWIIMTIILGVLITMLWRRWERPAAHLFSKPLAVGFFSWILLLSLGEIVPRLSESDFFPSESAFRRFSVLGIGLDSQAGMALLWAGGFGVVGLITLMTLTASLAPTLDTYLRARQGAARSPRGRLALLDDARSAAPWSLVLVVVLIAGWYFLLRQLFAAPYLRLLVTLDWSAPCLLTVAVAIPLLVWTLLLEWRGAKFATMTIFAAWLLPLMAGIVSVLAGVPATSWPRWLFGASGFVLPLLGSMASLRGMVELTFDLGAFMPVWKTFIVIYAVITLALYLRLRHNRATTLLKLTRSPAPVDGP